MLILCDHMPQSGATGAWAKVEYHTILTIPFFLYFDTGKPLYFNCFKKGAFPAIFVIFWCNFFFKINSLSILFFTKFGAATPYLV